MWIFNQYKNICWNNSSCKIPTIIITALLTLPIFLFFKALVKFGTKNWVDGEADWHYYEGTWKTVKDDGVYKMLKSKILEVENPGWDWFYE